MQELIKISSKGQIVIPKTIREAANIQSGDQLLVEWDGEQIKFQKLMQAKSKPEASLVRELLGKYQTTGEPSSIRKDRETLYGKVND